MQVPDAGFDVVPYQAHAFHAFDAPCGGLICFPGFYPHAFAGFQFRFVAKDDDDVDRLEHFVGDGFGVLAGDVDAELGQRLNSADLAIFQVWCRLCER